MSESSDAIRGDVLRRIPSGLYVITAAFERRRAAVMSSWVQRASTNPDTICVAIPKGERIAPLIRDSRGFAINQLCAENRFLTRRFQSDVLDWGNVDSLIFTTAETGSPLLKRAISCIDCRLVRHFDLEADHDLYVGEVAAVVNNQPDATPLILHGPDSIEPHPREIEPTD